MTNAELAVLSLIVEQPRHGYEIEQVIDQRGMRDWTEIGFSSIYFLLNKLEKAGLIFSRITPAAGKGPARRVYTTTGEGVEALRQGIMAALAQPPAINSSFQLGLANLPGLAMDEALDALQQRCQGLAERYAQVKQKWESQHPLPYFVDAMFDNSLSMLQAELDWTQTFIRKLETKNDEA